MMSTISSSTGKSGWPSLGEEPEVERALGEQRRQHAKAGADDDKHGRGDQGDAVRDEQPRDAAQQVGDLRGLGVGRLLGIRVPGADAAAATATAHSTATHSAHRFTLRRADDTSPRDSRWAQSRAANPGQCGHFGPASRPRYAALAQFAHGGGCAGPRREDRLADGGISPAPNGYPRRPFLRRAELGKRWSPGPARRTGSAASARSSFTTASNGPGAGTRVEPVETSPS